MNRFSELKQILEDRRYFKIVCGAGNEDAKEVRKLTLVYTLAGALGIDISANVDVVRSAVKGIDQAFEIAESMGIEVYTRPFINVSVGLKGDPHVRKAMINNELCSQCRVCAEVCEQEAIEETGPEVIQERCIGCGKCEERCNGKAISYYTRRVDFERILPLCLEAGAENIELHAIIEDEVSVMRDWKVIDRLVPDQFISMCLDRSFLSDSRLAQRIANVFEISGERTIIQADGAPMSGGSDNFNTTLQAVAIADMVNKSRIPVKLLGSGGTNSRTGELALMCDVPLHGVSVGTFARKKVRHIVINENFDTDKALIEEAVQIARTIVDNNLSSLNEKNISSGIV